ncbi:hypothetical protein LTR66_006042 [Elasticomyces elasticus]|nr:hypothetical protein LTR28_008043 [Elasticomyces elasticus]KAK4993363.1 hypothetical protein LTR66_006042 [Elasticomyces elasticus]
MSEAKDYAAEAGTPLERAKAYWLYNVNIIKHSDNKHFTADLVSEYLTLEEATVLTPTTARLVAKLKVDSSYCNPLNSLHGGAQALIYDMLTTTTLAPISRPGFWSYGGVSRTLTVTYLRPAAEGETIVVECEVVHAGKRLAALKGVMKRERDGALISTCEHDKVNNDPGDISKI